MGLPIVLSVFVIGVIILLGCGIMVSRFYRKVLQGRALIINKVTKEPIGTKGCRLTSYISLPGKGREILEDLYLEIFERELEAWHTDESAWPTARTFEVFCEWFDIEMHSIVEDLCGDLITDDEVNE